MKRMGLSKKLYLGAALVTLSIGGICAVGVVKTAEIYRSALYLAEFSAAKSAIANDLLEALNDCEHAEKNSALATNDRGKLFFSDAANEHWLEAEKQFKKLQLLLNEDKNAMGAQRECAMALNSYLSQLESLRKNMATLTPDDSQNQADALSSGPQTALTTDLERSMTELASKSSRPEVRDALTEARAALLSWRGLEMMHMSDSTEKGMARLEERMAPYRDALSAAMTRVKQEVPQDAELNALAASVETFAQNDAELLRLSRDLSHAKSLEVFVNQERAAFAAAKSEIDALLRNLRAEVHIKAEQAQAEYLEARDLIVVSAILGALFAFTFSAWVNRDLLRTLNRVSARLARASHRVREAANQAAQASSPLAPDKHSATVEMADIPPSAVEQARAAMQRMSQVIEEIKSTSDGTIPIIRTFDEIALQTKVLALNATLAATRTGERGEELAHVAEEIRARAQRSAELALDTAQLIEQAQRSSNSGVLISQQMKIVLEEIFSSVSTAGSRRANMGSAFDASDENEEGSAAGLKKTAFAAEELAAQAAELKEAFEQLNAVITGSQTSAFVSDKKRATTRLLPEPKHYLTVLNRTAKKPSLLGVFRERPKARALLGKRGDASTARPRSLIAPHDDPSSPQA